MLFQIRRRCPPHSWRHSRCPPCPRSASESPWGCRTCSALLWSAAVNRRWPVGWLSALRKRLSLPLGPAVGSSGSRSAGSQPDPPSPCSASLPRGWSLPAVRRNPAPAAWPARLRQRWWRPSANSPPASRRHLPRRSGPAPCRSDSPSWRKPTLPPASALRSPPGPL